MNINQTVTLQLIETNSFSELHGNIYCPNCNKFLTINNPQYIKGLISAGCTSCKIVISIKELSLPHNNQILAKISGLSAILKKDIYINVDFNENIFWINNYINPQSEQFTLNPNWINLPLNKLKNKILSLLPLT